MSEKELLSKLEGIINRRPSTRGDHVHSFLIALALAATLWSYGTLNDTQISVAGMKVDIATIKDNLKQATTDRYTGTEGRKVEKKVETVADNLNSHIRSDLHYRMSK